MRKIFFLLISIIWTSFVFYLCLIKSSDVPQINVVGIDKLVHIFLHFFIVFFWGLTFFQTQIPNKYLKTLWFPFLVSFLIGILIELMQAYLTTTRSADFRDILANLFGALFGVSFLKWSIRHFNFS